MHNKIKKLKNSILQGDIFDALKYLPDESIDCAVTSPPYWGQRDYEFAGQIGNEKNYNEYIEKLLSAFHILKNKLKSEGVFYLNIGDKYISKYGNVPLGMLPYKLAYQMIKYNWVLTDIIIWYKPNHMPSSVKNRFSNTYEPIFVFAKNKNNYYSEYKTKNIFSNVFEINTQPTLYNHIAVYPEKLIEKLLKINLPENSTILDPFAGSGTTAKSINNLNNDLFNSKNFNFILIEACNKYIEIIKERCSINEKKVITVRQNQNNNLIKIKENILIENRLCNSINDNNYSKKIIYKEFDNIEEVYNYLSFMIYGNFKNFLQENGLIYLVLKKYDIKLLNELSKICNYGWIIRNMLIIKKNTNWFPILLIVKDSKKYKYHFNLDNIRIKPKNTHKNNTNKIVFEGIKVFNNILYSNETKKGILKKVLEYYENKFPKVVTINWNYNNSLTNEFIINNGFDTKKYIEFLCPNCKNKLQKYYDLFNDIYCQSCNLKLWKDIYSIPLFIEKFDKLKIYKKNKYLKYKNIYQNNKNNYNGKYKQAKKINMGASPGARSSTQEPYFSVSRFYCVIQEMVADIINLHRIEKKMSKKELTELFPPDYKHTVGHWLRKDLGGSIPNLNDWNKLNEIFNFDINISNYVCKTGLKLQTVQNSYKGKNPGDFFKLPYEKIKKILYETSK